MVNIKSCEKGELNIDGTKYQFDVWIFSDGRVMQRDASLSKNNIIGMEEIQVILDNSQDLYAIILGNGQETHLSVDREILKKLAKKQVPVWSYTTCDATVVFNKQVKEGKKVAAILHLN